MVKEKMLSAYIVWADEVPGKVTIWDVETENVPVYKVEEPALGKGTESLIEIMRHDLAKFVPLEIEEATDPKKLEKMKVEFLVHIEKHVRERLPHQTKEEVDVISGLLLHKMFGLGFIELLLADDNLEEFAINGSKQPISIYHKKFGWCRTTHYIKTDEDVYNFSAQIGRKVGREINSLNPIMDAHLLTGDRVASTLFPISTAGNTITIRRFSRNPWTPIHMLQPDINTMSAKMAAFLWQAIQYELNIMIAGGTASGKTSMLNALCAFAPPTQRTISIEDTREISLPKTLEWNWVPLTSRNKNPEGQGEVTMLDLMVASLRMRPDRIVVGEVRRQQQAQTLFEAMNTGHSVYATMHADTALEVKRRLLEPPIQVPKSEVEAMHLVLIQYRDRQKGIRRSLELAEVLRGRKELSFNYLFRWRPRSDVFEKANESIRVVEDLNLHTGMTVSEIAKDLAEKETILNWMSSNKVLHIDDFGKIMRIYYKEPDVLRKAIAKKMGVKALLGRHGGV